MKEPNTKPDTTPFFLAGCVASSQSGGEEGIPHRRPLGCRYLFHTIFRIAHNPVFLSASDSEGSEYTALAYLDEATVTQGHSFGFIDNGAFVPSDISHFESYRVAA